MKTFVQRFVLMGSMLAAVSAWGIDNGGFETGTFYGWNLEVPSGISSASLPSIQLIPAGAAEVDNSWANLCAPEEGGFFANLRAGSQYRLAGSPYTPPGEQYDTYLSQNVFLNPGDTVSGWAFFYNGDATSQDSAWVKILGPSGTQIAMPWQDYSGQNCHDGSQWTCWNWQALSAGSYTLELGVTTQGDGLYSSHGIFDGIRVINVVPEPGPSALLAFALFLFAWKRFHAANRAQKLALIRSDARLKHKRRPDCRTPLG